MFGKGMQEVRILPEQLYLDIQGGVIRMRKRAIFLLTSFLSCLMLGGCSADPSNGSDVVYVQNVEDNNHVTINTKETVKVTPDMAKVEFAIRTEDESAEGCQQKNTEKLDELLAYLKKSGVADESIQTAGFSLNSRYNWMENERKLIGYEMTTEITVSDIEISQVGGILSGGIQAGANEIESVSYYASGYDAAYEEALTKAVQSARKKAEVIAAAGGCQITGLLSVEEYSDSQSGRYISSGLRSANVEESLSLSTYDAADMSVMAGEMEVTASIQAVFRLAGE
ncbi:MAG: SIMPL domain-containing protein [Clostridiales bacterium]|nr:SIMPL domain-containing protein [Clostridiales bacterium]